MQRLFSWGVWVNCSAVTPWSSLISTTTMSWMWFASKKVLWINFTRLQFFKEVWMLVLDKSSSRTRWSRTEVPFALVWKFDLTWVPMSSACLTLRFENDRVILWLFFNFSFVRRTPHFVLLLVAKFTVRSGILLFVKGEGPLFPPEFATSTWCELFHFYLFQKLWQIFI